MPKEYTLPPRLKLVVDHLKAIRTLDEYVTGGGLKKDMQDLFNHLQQDLNTSVLVPAGWEELYTAGGSLYSSPKAKWVVREDAIAIQIYPARPVQDVDEPSVGLYVPTTLKKRPQFIAKLKAKAPPGFEHVSQYPDGEMTEESSIFKYIPYTSYVGGDGLFDSAGFINAFRKATKTLVSMEKVIDGILKGLA